MAKSNATRTGEGGTWIAARVWFSDDSIEQLQAECKQKARRRPYDHAKALRTAVEKLVYQFTLEEIVPELARIAHHAAQGDWTEEDSELWQMQANHLKRFPAF